jgi:putative RNA 2'-phosphotransferase
MENEKRLIHMGKQLSFLLRHDSEAFSNGLIDKHGWRKVSELVKDHKYTKDLLDDIVKTNNKQRYEYNEDETLIRARQGHSIKVDVNLSESTPPDILYHGTATRFLDSILEKGIVKGNRLYVHLSKDEETATTVGARHGKPYVLKIDAKKMYEDGIKFYLSNNNVWLTDFVDVKYIIK